MNSPNGLLGLCMERFENNLHLRSPMYNIECWSRRGPCRKNQGLRLHGEAGKDDNQT